MNVVMVIDFEREPIIDFVTVDECEFEMEKLAAAFYLKLFHFSILLFSFFSFVRHCWKEKIKKEKNFLIGDDFRSLPLIGDDFCFDCSEYFGFRFLVWMPSFFMLCGRLTLCNLKYNPHALQTGSPWLLRRQRVVVLVLQFAQITPDLLFACACHQKLN